MSLVVKVAAGMLTLALCQAPVVAAAQESRNWLCAADGVTGFSYDGQKWVSSAFSTLGRSWVVSNASGEYRITMAGDNTYGFCDATHLIDRATLTCSPLFQEFTMRTDTRNYFLTYVLTYLKGLRTDDPILDIGRCTPF